jgi:hypothetical protein
MRKKGPSVVTYVRLSTEDRDWAEAQATADGLDVSDVIRRAVRAWRFGGAEAYAAAVAKRAPTPEPVPTQVLLYGERIRRLPEQLQVKVMEYADALDLLYANARAANGEVALTVGTVRNTWVAPRTAGKSQAPRKASSPDDADSAD